MVYSTAKHQPDALPAGAEQNASTWTTQWHGLQMAVEDLIEAAIAALEKSIPE